jgi:hypothetical protein
MTVPPCAAVWDDGGRGSTLRRRVDSQDQKQVTAMFLSELTNKAAELCGCYRCLCAFVDHSLGSRTRLHSVMSA